jgi:hypothetical protein
MMKTLCIAFLRLNAGDALPLPPEAQRLVESRLQTQWSKAQDNRPELRFDDPNCAEQGVYTYTPSGLILNADVASWRGRLELGLTELLDGARIPFERVTPLAHRSPPPESASFAVAPTEQGRNWLPWVAGAGALVAGAIAWKLNQSADEGATRPSKPQGWSVTY